MNPPLPPTSPLPDLTSSSTQISRPTPTLCCSSRQRRRHGIGFVAPPSATRLRHKHTAARSPIGALGPPTSIGGFYSRSISCSCSGLVTPPLGRRWWQHPASVITSMIVDNPAYTIVISWVAAAATVAAAVLSARAGRGSLSTVAATPGGAARVVEDAGGNADDTGRRTIVSFVKWVLTEAWRGGGTGKRGKIRLSSSPRRSANGHGSILKKWWVGAGMAWLVAKSFGGGRAGSSAPRRRDGVSAGGSAFKPAVEPSLTVQYPRPQSTAYPRPQSTAYPRPRVTIPTLLELELEEAMHLLPTKAGATMIELKGSKASSAKEEDNPLLSRFLCWFFARMIAKRARVVEGLEVSVDAKSNRDAMSGLLQAVGITFNHLELQTLRISAGATIRITGLDLKVMTLLWRRFDSFKKPFEVAGSFVFTSEDLLASAMVRRLVQNMMNATLRKLEVRVFLASSAFCARCLREVFLVCCV